MNGWINFKTEADKIVDLWIETVKKIEPLREKVKFNGYIIEKVVKFQRKDGE